MNTRDSDPTMGFAQNAHTRLMLLLGAFVEEGDKDLSDSEFVYRVHNRFQVAWRAKQAIIDPNE
jgi:hypothetical protein